MAKKLTTFQVEHAKGGEVRREVPDALIPGLYLIVQPAPSGKRSWAVRYRHLGKPRKFTLGSGALELKVARRMARDALELVAAGEDPANIKNAREAAEREAAEAAKAAAKAAAEAEYETFEAVAGKFVAQYAKHTQKSWRETERILNKEVIPLGARPIREVTKRDIIAVLDRMVERDARVGALKTYQVLRRMFGWAGERDLIDRSPFDTMKPPAVSKPRERWLDDRELSLVWRAAAGLGGYPFTPLVRLLVLLGARRGEVACMSWKEVDLDAGLWVLPSERAKNKAEHTVPLPPQALAILRALPHMAGTNLVFTTTSTTPVSGFTRIKGRLDDLVLAELRREAEETGRDPADVEPLPAWTLHDLRRSAATGWERLGVALPVTEKLLNHVSGSHRGITGVYQRHGYANEKRAALELWGAHIDALVNPPPQLAQALEGNVVQLLSGAR